jgi:hypothetical protein
VSERGLHLIDDDLREDSLAAWIAAGVSAVEAYLGKYAAFDAFLEGRDSAPAPG